MRQSLNVIWRCGLLAASIAGVACSSRLASPTSATTVTPVVTVNAASSPQAGSSVFANASDWRLTTVLTSVVGASGCQFPGSPPVGQSVLWELSVGRSDHTVTFDYDVRNYPTDDLRESGELVGDAFTATSGDLPMSGPGCPNGTFRGTVTGRFLDDSHLTGKEVWSYSFPSGTVEFHLDWSALGPNAN